MSDQLTDWGEWTRPTEGDWPEAFKFTTPGDQIVGIITRVRVATMPDTKRLPELTLRLDDNSERQVLASQVRLQSKLAELRPASGDRIAIVFTGTEPSSVAGRSPIKCFEVEMKRGDGASSSTPTPEPQPAATSAKSLL